jgi:hypothetical protein
MKNLCILLIITASLGIQKTFAQQLIAKNVPSKTTSRYAVAEGPEVWGVFDGRVACQPMAAVLKTEVAANCEKLKWSFTFFQDPQTHQPTRYFLRGSLYRNNGREGTWKLIKGTADDAQAWVIQLDADKPEQSVFLQKGNENVLFFLDRDKNLMVGGDYLSYTFNRVQN